MYKIKLELGRKTYDLQSCHYSCYNTPASNSEEEYYNPTPHSMTWNVKPSKIDQDMLDWCTLAKQETRSGKITIIELESNTPLKIISFENAFCTGFNESVDASYDYNQSPTSISVSVETIQVRLFTINKGIISSN